MFRPFSSVRVIKIDGQPIMCASRAFLMNFLSLLPSSPSFLSHSLIFLDRLLSLISTTSLFLSHLCISTGPLLHRHGCSFFMSPLACFEEHGTREEFSTTGYSLTPFGPCSQLSPCTTGSFFFLFFFSNPSYTWN
jgi:hypothetical protein